MAQASFRKRSGFEHSKWGWRGLAEDILLARPPTSNGASTIQQNPHPLQNDFKSSEVSYIV